MSGGISQAPISNSPSLMVARTAKLSTAAPSTTLKCPTSGTQQTLCACFCMRRWLAHMLHAYRRLPRAARLRMHEYACACCCTFAQACVHVSVRGCVCRTNARKGSGEWEDAPSSPWRRDRLMLQAYWDAMPHALLQRFSTTPTRTVEGDVGCEFVGWGGGFSFMPACLHVCSSGDY